MQQILNAIKQSALLGIDKSSRQNAETLLKTFLAIMNLANDGLRELDSDSTANADSDINWLDFDGELRSNQRLEANQRRNMFRVACYFARYEHEDLYPYLNQGEAFMEAARTLGVKKATLQNTRDLFDGQMPETHRRGWIDPPMSPGKRRAVNSIINECRTKSRYELRDELREILHLC